MSSDTIADEPESESARECEYGECRKDGEHLVHSEEWGRPTDRTVCDEHVRFARLNDNYEVVSNV